MTTEQKKQILANIVCLSKLKKVSLGDIEKNGGVSAGYCTRASKDPENAKIPVDLLVSASQALEVTVDELINHNFNQSNSTEDYVMNLIVTLINDTNLGKLEWHKETQQYFNNIEENGCNLAELHPMYRINWDGYGNPESICYNCMFIDEEDDFEISEITGTCYNTQIGKNAWIYLMSAGLDFDKNLELYLWDSEKQHPLCDQKHSHNAYKDILEKLRVTAKASCAQVRLNTEAKSVLDNYLKKGR